MTYVIIGEPEAAHTGASSSTTEPLGRVPRGQDHDAPVHLTEALAHMREALQTTSPPPSQPWKQPSILSSRHCHPHT
eukprot:5725145-Prorocentrum_lima.AAC.1